MTDKTGPAMTGREAITPEQTTPEWAMQKARAIVAELLRQDGFVAADIADVLSGSEDEVHGIAFFARALAAEREAATMAERERAAKYHDTEVVRLKMQIEENDAYLAKQGLWKDSAANRYCEAQIYCHEISAAAIRAGE